MVHSRARITILILAHPWSPSSQRRAHPGPGHHMQHYLALLRCPWAHRFGGVARKSTGVYRNPGVSTYEESANPILTCEESARPTAAELDYSRAKFATTHRRTISVFIEQNLLPPSWALFLLSQSQCRRILGLVQTVWFNIYI